MQSKDFITKLVSEAETITRSAIKSVVYTIWLIVYSLNQIQHFLPPVCF